MFVSLPRSPYTSRHDSSKVVYPPRPGSDLELLLTPPQSRLISLIARDAASLSPLRDQQRWYRTLTHPVNPGAEQPCH